MSSISNPVESSIRNKLSTSGLGINYVEVLNESYMHNVPKAAETHFKVIVVAQEFEGLNLLKVFM